MLPPDDNYLVHDGFYYLHFASTRAIGRDSVYMHAFFTVMVGMEKNWVGSTGIQILRANGVFVLHPS